jgi:PAS domain S-box-containing protein
VVLLSALPVHVASELQSGVPLPMVLGWYVSNCSEALIGAGLMRMLIDEPIELDTSRRVRIFVVFAALLAPLLSSFMDAGFVKWLEWGSGTYWDVWRSRFLSNVLAILAIVPVMVTWGNLGIRSLASVSRSRILEAVLLMSALFVVSVTVFAGPAWGFQTWPILIFAPMPFLLWAAVRFGPAGTSACLLVFSLLSVWGAIHGQGPFVGQPLSSNVLPLQLFLIVTYIPLIGLSAAIRERAHVEQEARRSAEQLNLALGAAQMRTWDWDIGSLRDAWSEKAGEVLGLVKDNTQAVLPGFNDVVSASDRASVRDAITRAINVGTPYEAEFRIARFDGTTQWVLGKGTVVNDAHGRPSRLIGVNVDVTERKLAEMALRDEAVLRENEARLRELADAMPQVVFTARPDGRIDYFNQKWCDLTGLTNENVSNRMLLSIIHAEDRASAIASWRASIRAGMPHEYQGRFLSVRTATFRWHLVRALPVRNEAGRIVHWYGTATDIDDHKRVEQTLRHTQVRLRAFQRGLEHRVKERTAELSLANATLREEVVGRVRTEQALRASEERFAKAFRASPDAISIARRPEIRLIEINDRWEALFGHSRWMRLAARSTTCRSSRIPRIANISRCSWPRRDSCASSSWSCATRTEHRCAPCWRQRRWTLAAIRASSPWFATSPRGGARNERSKCSGGSWRTSAVSRWSVNCPARWRTSSTSRWPRSSRTRARPGACSIRASSTRRNCRRSSTTSWPMIAGRGTSFAACAR